MRLEAITSAEQLEALRPEWSALWDRCPAATPFQSPEWLIPWWEIFHPGSLVAAAVRDETRLAGFAPLYLAEDRVVRFIGTGNTDYMDVLLEPSARAPGMPLLLGHLKEMLPAWNRCDLLELPSGSPLIGVIPPEGIKSESAECSVCPVAPLPAKPASAIVRNVRRYGRRLALRGDATYESGCGQHYDEYLDALFRLHSARWEERHGPGVLSDPRVREFHKRVASRFAPRGWLAMFGLRIGGTLGAVVYGFAARSRLYLYLTGFAPDLRHYSPGVLLMSYALGEAARAGMIEADFLRGRESYKYLWGAKDRRNLFVTLRPAVSGA